MPDQPHRAELALPVPEELVEALADAIAERLDRRLPGPAAAGEPGSPWLDVEGACAYLGFSRDRLYKLTAARAIPHRKRAGGQGLRFHRAELDAWMEEAYPGVDRPGRGELSSPVFLSTTPNTGPRSGRR